MSLTQPSAGQRLADNHDILHMILSYVNRETYRSFHNTCRSFSRVARSLVHRYINLPGSLMSHLADFASSLGDPFHSLARPLQGGCGQCGDRDWCLSKTARERCVTIKIGRHSHAQCASLAPHINLLFPNLVRVVLTSSIWHAYAGGVGVFEHPDPCPLLCALKPQKVIFQNLDSFGWPASLFDADEDHPLEVDDAVMMLPTDRELLRIVSIMRLRYHMRSLRVKNLIRIVFNPEYDKSPFEFACECGCGQMVHRDAGNTRLTVMEMACFLRSVCLPRDGLRYEIVGLENVPLQLGEICDFPPQSTSRDTTRLASIVMDGLQGFVKLRGVLGGKWNTLTPLNVVEQASVTFLPISDHKMKQSRRGMTNQ